MDLVGPVVDTSGTLVPVPVGEDRVVGDAERPVHLDGQIDGPEHRVGDHELDGGDLVTGRVDTVAIDDPRGVQREEAGGADLGIELGDPVLDDLTVGEGLAALGDHALVGPVAEHLEGPGGDPQPAHAVVDAPRSESLLGDPEAVTDAAQHVGRRDPARLVRDLAMAVVTDPGVAHHADVADQLEPRGVRGNDEHRGSAVRRGGGIGDGHDDGEGRAVGRGGEPLLAVQDVVVTVGHGTRRQQRGVGPRRLRLGHREAAADLALDERTQPARTLLRAPMTVEDLHVAGVGCLGPERPVTQRRPAERFGEQSVLDHRQPETSAVDRGVRRPQPHLPHLALHPQHGDLEGARISAVQELALQRQQLAPHEAVDHRQHDRHPFRRFEIHHDLHSPREPGRDAGSSWPTVANVGVAPTGSKGPTWNQVGPAQPDRRGKNGPIGRCRVGG